MSPSASRDLRVAAGNGIHPTFKLMSLYETAPIRFPFPMLRPFVPWNPALSGTLLEGPPKNPYIVLRWCL
ncbi:hypothetical protein BOSEA31B_13923 [Hyphomicrobiales bacterium]|nr:hypothetical protein BOSEA31B_13923 [Hyphomicrobiales bacterium]CAH1699699.1 hypothetical protein BOSEA1005_12752 [Hyphomicrobiales bacterium]